MNLSEARAKLPQIARTLAREPRTVVYVEHRDMDDRLAVTTESHLRYLETMVREMTRRNAPPFRLEGSVQAVRGVDPGEVIDEMRREAAAAFEAKLALL